MSQASCVGTLVQHLGEVEDRRVVGRSWHKLVDILCIAVCAIISGADDYVGMADFGKERRAWLETFLELPNGIPSHDTFGRVLALLDPVQLQTCFVSLMQHITDQSGGDIIALDGKALRGSHDLDAGQQIIYMVSAWSTANGMVLGQSRVDEKSNEIKAIPRLLEWLDLAGCLVTIDAMGCQTAIAAQIIAQKADYLLALKGNQGRLHEDVVLLFDDLVASNSQAYAHDYTKEVCKGHGRIETREGWTITDPTMIAALRRTEDFAGLRTLVKIRATRRIGSQISIEDRYYIGSATPSATDALTAVRAHWQIENQLHWVLDVTFREDDSRVRRGNAPNNLAVLRHLALNALRRETSEKRGIKNKRLRAAWSVDYLSKVLAQLEF